MGNFDLTMIQAQANIVSFLREKNKITKTQEDNFFPHRNLGGLRM